MRSFTVPREVRNVEGLGEVLVRSLTFAERTAYDDKYIDALGSDVRDAIRSKAGESDDEAAERSKAIAGLLNSRRVQFAGMSTYLLSLCVRETNGDQLMSEDDWDAFGAGKNRKIVSELHALAYKLSGLDVEDAEKKSESDPALDSAPS